MVLFWPIQQELDCITTEGKILGKIKFDLVQEQYLFHPNDKSVQLSQLEQKLIEAKITQLDAGNAGIPMQDDD